MNDLICGDKPTMTTLVKKECVSSDDDDDDTMTSCGNAFMCEICHFTDDESHAVFKERDDLVLHTFKNHTSTCIGCFENFHSPDDLMKHVMVENHGLPFCRECRRLFPDQRLLIRHPCQITSANEEESSDESEDDGPIVKLEPQSEESEFVYSSEEDPSDEREHLSGDCRLSCIHCTAEGFRKRRYLQKHTYKAHPTVCIICFEGFDDETSLQNHQKALNHTIWKCTKCDKYFMRRMYYRMHVSIYHQEDCSYQCTYCDWKGLKKAEMVNHQSHVHGTSKFIPKIKLDWRIYNNRCNICLKTFMTGYSRVLHTFKEHNKLGQTHVYKCEVCQLGFGRARAFEIHLKEHHVDDTDYLNEAKTLLESTLAKSPNCEVCGELHSDHRDLRKHILSVHPELRPHKCNICGAEYPEESDVQVHIWSDHEGPPGILCPVCDFSGRDPNHLESHLTKKHGFKGMPYIYCFVHKKKFSRFVNYNKHFELEHLDPADRPVRPPAPTTGFPCHLCSKEFGSSHKVKEHVIRVHQSREKVKCDVCGKLFKDVFSLTGHKRKHTDDFKCKICNKTFEMKCHLDRHQVVHSGEKPFQCELCGLKVSQRSALQRHVKVVHANGKPSKVFKARRTRGPKHENGMNQGKTIHEKQVNDVDNHSVEYQEVLTGDAQEETVKKTCTRGRKRREDSKSPSGELSETMMLPKRRRGRPRKSNTKDEEQHIKDDVKMNPRRRRRQRNAKDKAERQLHKQATSDDDHIVSDDEEFQPSDDNSTDYK